MTDEQRKSVALEYLKAFDRGGVTSNGGSVLDLFADDAQVCSPKWGLATGKEEIGRCLSDVGGAITLIEHHYAGFNWIFSGSDAGAGCSFMLRRRPGKDTRRAVPPLPRPRPLRFRRHIA
ncbi:hypothetical protein [Streptomyces sp. NPDC101234]|uniref:hypothetical protein n=1 Tax=Streptomyces sp. NPDC101234 TaxID=3366138 RepID=UPI0038048AD2